MEKESTTAEIIKYLLNCQSIKYEQNVKHKLTEFVVKYTTNLLEESKKYGNHAQRDYINEDDVRLAVKNSKEKTSRLDTKDLEDAEKLSSKFQFKEIKDTPFMQLGQQELENMKPIKHLVTSFDVTQSREGPKPTGEIDLQSIYRNLEREQNGE